MAKKLAIYSTNPYLVVDMAGVTPTYTFNGTTDSATMVTPWFPNGFPFTVQASTDLPDVITGGAVLSSGSFGLAEALGFGGGYSVEGVLGNLIDLFPSPDISIPAEWRMDVKPDGVIAYDLQSGEAATINTENTPISISMAPYEHIGFNGTASYQKGVIKDIYLTDNSPIQGREYWTGTAVNGEYGLLDNPITVSDQAFTLSFQWVRENNLVNGTGVNHLISKSGLQNAFQLRVFDDAHGQTPDQISLQVGAPDTPLTAIWVDALADVAIGQHIEVVIDRATPGSAVTLTVDGVPQARTGNTLIGKSGTFDTIGASNTGGNSVRGALANLEVTSDTPIFTPGTRFVDFDDAAIGVNGVVDKFTALASDAMGATAAGSGNVAWNAVLGFILPNDESGFGPSWPQIADILPSFAADGFTLQFEIENGMFEQGLVTPTVSGGLTSLMYGSNGGVPNICYDGNLKAWNPQTDPDGAVYTVETNNILQTSTHDLVTMSFTGSNGGPNGEAPKTIHVYRNKFLIWSNTFVGDIFPANAIYIGGSSGAAGGLFPYSPQFHIRNVVLLSHPTMPTPNTRVATIGDSQFWLGQYCAKTSTTYPAHNPPIYGYDGLDYDPPRTTATVDVPYYMFDETMFSRLTEYMSERGLYPAQTGSTQQGIASYARGSSGILYESAAGAGNLDDRLNSLYGVAGYPEPGIQADPDIDVLLINAGGNDAYYFGITLGTTPDANDLDEIRAAYKAAIDRAISTSKPRTIVCCTCGGLSKFLAPPGGITYNNLLLVNDVIREFDGYAGVCVVADLWALIQGNQDYFIDTVGHFNQEGFSIMARAIASVVDGLATGTQTYTFPLAKNDDNALLIENTANSGAVYNGYWTVDNFEYVPTNSRLYRINEGEGLKLNNSLHDPKDLTDTSATLTSIQGWD